MAKLEWSINQDIGPDRIKPLVRGGFTGVPQMKVGLGLFNPMTPTGGSYVIALSVVDGANEIFYKDDSGIIKLCDYYYYGSPPCSNYLTHSIQVSDATGGGTTIDQQIIPGIIFSSSPSNVPQFSLFPETGFVDAPAVLNSGFFDSLLQFFNGPQIGSLDVFYGSLNPIPEVRVKTGTCEFTLAENVFTGQITDFPPISVLFDVENVTTTGGSDGEIDLIITGGSGTRTYVWGDGPTTEDRTGLSAGTYTVTVNDQLVGFLDTFTIEITEEILSTDPCIDREPVNPVNFIRFKGVQNVTLTYLQANGLPDCNKAENPAVLTGVFDETFDQTFE